MSKTTYPKVTGIFSLPEGGTSGQSLVKNSSTDYDITWSTITSGTPGGSNTQIQYNNSGAFGGISSFTYDGTNVDVLDSVFRIKDNLDQSKIAVFQASGITTGTTRTYTFADETGILAIGRYGIDLATSGSLAVHGFYNTGMSGTQNTLYGYLAGGNITSGSNITAIGYAALGAITTSSNCVAIGTGMLANMSGGTQNLGIGYNSLVQDTTSQNNISIGFGNLNDVNNGGGGNLVIGLNSGNGVDVAGLISIGNSNLTSLTSASSPLAIGTSCGSGQSLSISNSALIGFTVATQDNCDISDSTFIGTGLGNGDSSLFTTTYLIGQNMFANASSYTVGSTVGIGANVFIDTTAANSSVGIGVNIIPGAQTTTSSDIFLGFEMYSNSAYIGSENVFIGNNIGISASGNPAPSGNIVIGSGAGISLQDGADNVLIGRSVGQAFSSDVRSTIIGAGAGTSAVGNELVLIGFSAGANLSGGGQNTAIGSQAMVNGDLTDCIAVGYKALYGASGTKSNLIGIGSQAGSAVNTNTESCYIGIEAQPTSDSASNEFVTGSNSCGYRDYYFGKGSQALASPFSDVTFYLTNSLGTNVSGSNFHFYSGLATGNALSGSIQFKTGIAGSSGTTLQTATTAVEIDGYQRLRSYYGRVKAVRVVTASGAVTIASSDSIVVVNKTTGAATTVNLPSSPTTGTEFIIKDGKGDAATNNLTITPASGNIDGAGTYVINVNYQSITIVYNGTQWNIC